MITRPDYTITTEYFNLCNLTRRVIPSPSLLVILTLSYSECGRISLRVNSARNLNEIASPSLRSGLWLTTPFAHNDVCVINKMQVFNAFYILIA